MPELAAVPGLTELWALTLGDPRVRVAVIDGAPDLTHECFEGAAIERVACGWTPEHDEHQSDDKRKASVDHGTWTTGVLVGQRGSASPGVAPGCTVLSVPGIVGEMADSDPLNTARCIEAACAAGAHVIVLQQNLPSPSGDIDGLLKSAISAAHEAGILLVIPAGNDNMQFCSFPQALPEVLLVGAHDDDGVMFKFSSWGFGYEQHGIVAPGGSISGPEPGGGLATHKGTCCSAAVVAGVAALLLTLQLQQGEPLDPLAIGEALLATARPCAAQEAHGEPERCLAGKLDIVAAATRRVLQRDAPSGLTAASAGAARAGVVTSEADQPMAHAPAGPLVYALGSLGYDFGTHARRDSFAQIMAPVNLDGTVVPANPYSPRQLLDHLAQHPSEAEALIWTLNIELTPIYAIGPTGAHALTVYKLLARLLADELADADDPRRIERVALPGRLTGQNVKLFSGQVVPVIDVQQTRAIHGWPTVALAQAARAHPHHAASDPDQTASLLHEFLTHIYYELRNLGLTAGDRAINYAITNAFQANDTLVTTLANGMTLDAINVQRSEHCRPDSDCWDVTLRFFDPENLKRARRVSRYEIDVSDSVPVTLGPVRTWSQPPPHKAAATAMR